MSTDCGISILLSDSKDEIHIKTIETAEGYQKIHTMIIDNTYPFYKEFRELIKNKKEEGVNE